MFTALFIAVVLLFSQIDGGLATQRQIDPAPAGPRHVSATVRGVPLHSVTRKVALTACAGSAALLIAAWPSGAPRTREPPVPQPSLTQLNTPLSAMATLKPLAARGKGNVAVIL